MLPLQSKGQSIVCFSFNLSFAEIAVTLCKAKFGGTANHPGVARPSLCVQFGYTAVKIVVTAILSRRKISFLGCLFPESAGKTSA